MRDRPDAATLLRAMAETLTGEVVPATQDGAQHAARVVANLCRILAREVSTPASEEAASRAARAGLLGALPDDSDGIAELDARLLDSDEAFDAEARRVLLQDVRHRLAIHRPGYDA